MSRIVRASSSIVFRIVLASGLLLASTVHAEPESEGPDSEETMEEGTELDEEAEESDDEPMEPEAPEGPPIDPLLGEPYEPTRPGQVTPDSPYWDLEVMYTKAEHLKAAEIAEKRYAETGDAHLTLYIARSWYQYLEGNEEITDKKERLAIYDKALAFLEEGLEKTPDDPHLHFAKGVLLGRIGTTRGVMASLRSADDIENAWLKALESDYTYGSIKLQEEIPCDTYLALGIFYRLVPDSWLVKALTGTRGDLNKSLEMQQKGVQCSGDRVRNLKELGVTQMCLGTTNGDDSLIEDGRKSINRYLALSPRTQAEIVDMKHGVALLSDPTLACGYSRDGQQELDEAKAE